MLIVFSSSGMARLHCITLLPKASLKPAACCCRATQTSLLRQSDYPLLFVPCTEILFSHVDCFLVYREGWTPLHDSASEGQLETCRLLLQSNADVAAKEK
jgi:ankyrin repeat protein